MEKPSALIIVVRFDFHCADGFGWFHNHFTTKLCLSKKNPKNGNAHLHIASNVPFVLKIEMKKPHRQAAWLCGYFV